MADLNASDPTGPEVKKDITVGNRTISVSTTRLVAKDVVVKSAIDRNQRRALPADKLDTYLERMKRTVVKKPFTRFQNKIEIKDADELIEASDLLANIDKLNQHLRDYDADDVFNVMDYHEATPGDILESTNILELEQLFRVTRDEVAKSNVWWHSVLDGDDAITAHENLRMSLLFFENNVEPKLHSTVMDELDKFSPQEKGGPLYYIILIELILNDGVSIALTWIQNVKELDIKKIEGEDILLFSKYVRGLLSLSRALEAAGSITIVTADFPDIIINLLTNTSSEEFNNVFKQKRTEKLIGTSAGAAGVTGSSVIRSRLTALNNVYDEVKKLLNSACDVYTRLSGTPEWKGLQHKASAFLVEGCFNCGDKDCSVSTCPKPINQPEVDRKRKLWQAERKQRNASGGGRGSGGRGGRGQGGRGRGRGGRGAGRGGRGAGRGGRGGDTPGKWCAPTDAEKEAAARENRKPERIIKRGRDNRDSLNEYHFDSRRWVEKSANVVQPTDSSSSSTPRTDNDTARLLVNQSDNFNQSEISDREYITRISNMELAISRVRQTWE